MAPEPFLALTSSLPESMLLVSADGMILAANQAARETLGAAAGDHFAALVSDPPEAVRRSLQLWRGSSALAPAMLHWKRGGLQCEGALLPAGTPGSQAALLVRCRPVDARDLRAVNELNEKIESLGATLANIGDAVIVTDREGRATYLNPVAERLTGWPAALAEGHFLSSIIKTVDQSTREPLEDPVLAVLRDGESGSLPPRTILIPRDGAERFIDVRGSPIRDDRGRMLGVVIVFRDVTEQVKAEEEYRQTQKLESLGLLAGGVAHDFNNLLTGILGNASLALEALGPGNPVERMLEDVVTASERAADLTRQLLAYAGRGRFLIRRVDLSELVREIGSLVRSSISRNVELELELADRLPSIEGDPAQLQQLVMNLVINGAEAIGEERYGVVRVRTGRGAAPDEEVPGLKAAVWLEVSDNGCGMDEATRSQIFDPFFTTKFTGRGLGLAAAHGIVRSHKGAIHVETEPGMGATFTVFFPAADEPAERAQPARARATAGRGAVLVVDDEDVVRGAAKLSLERFGYIVLLAENGREAVETLRRMPDAIDLIILDMTMPVMSGEEALGQLRQIRPDVKVILSSGYNEAEAMRRFSGRGLAGFLQKPYTAAQISNLVGAVVKRSGRPAVARSPR